MLPPRIKKEDNLGAPKRWKSTAHCNFVRDHQCCVPMCNERPIEVAHVRRGSDAGMGRKPSDWHTISLCQMHHTRQHAHGEQTFEKDFGIDMAALADAFAKASPKSREIAAEKKRRQHA